VLAIREIKSLIFSSAFRTAALLTSISLGYAEIIEDRKELNLETVLVYFYGGCSVAYIFSTVAF
jgi:hypothetical protein